MVNVSTHGRFQTCILDKKLCSDCGSRMRVYRRLDPTVIWKCGSCGYEVTEKYKDVDKVIWKNQKAWDN